jgi:hypothetical protein
MEYVPPLPEVITRVLGRTRLAYLATCEEASPHLSLMNYSWLTDDEALGGGIVMTTRRDTKKFAALVANPKVALLVHDFKEGARGVVGTCSITLYGNCVVQSGEAAERLRLVHLASNPEYANFIAGEGIAVLWLQPTLARLVDLTDTVSTWAAPRPEGASP